MSLATLAVVGAVLLLLYLLPLLLALIAIRSGPVPVPRFAEVDAAWLDADWIESARPTVERLEALGFVHRTYLDGMAPRTDPTGVRCAAVLVNEETGDMAQVAVVERYDDDGDIELTSLTILTCTLGTKRIATMNGDMPSVFVYPKTFVGNALPVLHNAETLFRAHRAIVAHHAPGAKRGEIVSRGNEVKFLTRQSADDMGYQVRRGMLRATTDGGYERTWLGAAYGVWKLHPRFIGKHRRRAHERALRLLAEFDLAPDPEVQRAPRPTMGEEEFSPASTA